MTNTFDKNDTVQLFYILITTKLCWKYPSILNDGFDIHRFSTREQDLTMCTVGNLNIRNIPKSTGKFPMNQSCPQQNIFVQYYFCAKCTGHLCMFQNILSHRKLVHQHVKMRVNEWITWSRKVHFSFSSLMILCSFSLVDKWFSVWLSRF